MRGFTKKRGSTWSAVIYLGRDDSGMKKYKWFSGYNSQKEAQKALADILQDVKKNRIVDNNAITVRDFFQLWIKDHVDPNLSPGTGDKYQSAADSASVSFGNVKMQKLTPHHVQKWVNAMAESQLSKASAVTYFNAIKAAFNKAVSWRIINVTPCLEITLPKIKKKSMKTLSAREVSRLLQEAEDHPIHLVILLAASCGLRRGEILGLRWRQVDLNAQTLHISENYTESSKGIILSELKTDSSYRTVDFGDAIKKALRKQHARQMEALTSASVVRLSDLNEDNLQDLHVCTWYDLTPLGPSFVTKKFGKIIKKAALPPIRFHDLRHTHATLLLQAGVHPKVVQERLGHSKISITLDTYSHVLPSMQKEAAQLLNF
ncbi:MAG: tyrosine-type recombinase/integrase [Bacillota bacterium]|nr:tyrosine-type recombinase/integrase [Bacillota bacterium]MDW7677902.1 tyrosine-type recombinase/integrase [Bacillota bacterium]